jgi:hypothetical protein
MRCFFIVENHHLTRIHRSARPESSNSRHRSCFLGRKVALLPRIINWYAIWACIPSSGADGRTCDFSQKSACRGYRVFTQHAVLCPSDLRRCWTMKRMRLFPFDGWMRRDPASHLLNSISISLRHGVMECGTGDGSLRSGVA